MNLGDNGTYRDKQYMLTDHLGSPDVIFNSSMWVTERLSFDPWGLRRNADWSPPTAPDMNESPTGFTGHEMDDAQSLVNMNARIYDPVMGRFLSPDSMIPGPYDPQSFNRYSYVNNPLSLVDPTGISRQVQMMVIGEEIVLLVLLLGRVQAIVVMEV